jgi:putative tryptophan/tyrosine transport system substrate-binding protein
VLASSLLNGARSTIVRRLNAARLPSIYQWPETSAEGGLLGYGPRLTLCYRHVAGLVSKILHGSSPADLPIEQPTKFELVINLRTAKALGLAIPPTLLARADEVIE